MSSVVGIGLIPISDTLSSHFDNQYVELTKCDVSDFASAGILYTWYALQFQRRISSEEHLRRILNSTSSRIHELLDEDLSKHSVRLLSENSAKDDSDSVMTGLDVDGFLLAIMDGHDLSTFLDTLWCFFGCVLGSGFL